MATTRMRCLVGYIISTAFAVMIAAMSHFTPSTAEWPPGASNLTISLERHFNDALVAFDHISVAPMRHAEEISAPDRQSVADVLFESHRQPGQDWRIAATAYRHIDPGRRFA